MSKDIITIPVIALRGMTAFPNITVNIDVTRFKSIEALQNSVASGQSVFLASQRNASDEVTSDDLYQVGTIAKVKQIIKMPGNIIRVVAECEGKGEIHEMVQEKPFFIGEIEKVETTNEMTEVEEEAIVDLMHEMFEKYTALSGRFMPDFIMDVLSSNSADELANLLAYRLGFSIEQKQEILEENDVKQKALLLLKRMNREIELLTIQKDISKQVRSKIDKNQKDFYLREQLKTINKELGNSEEEDDEIEEYVKKLRSMNVPEYVSEKMDKEIKRLRKIPISSSENIVSRDYIEMVLSLPWDKETKVSTDLKKAQEILDKDHYGLEKVKERIIEYLAVRQNTNNIDAPIICLSGPPGVGKTSIAKSIARALNRKYVRMSLGGIHDEAEIRGHRKTYIGAMPGRIITSIKQAGTKNPLILFDEIDKLGKDYKGDPASALLEVLDGEQNFSFRDNYLEMSFDISNVLFMCTANDISNIPQALKDRLEIIPLSSYTEEEKFHIAKDFLIPKQYKKHGLKKSNLKIKDEQIRDIINGYTREAGVRQLERMIGQICRKAVKKIMIDAVKSITVNSKNLSDFLGKVKFKEDKLSDSNEVGVVCGLAWTSVGGDTLSVEVNTTKGKGNFSITGNIGKVMDESAKAAISYIRANCKELSIDEDFYRKTDIHIHIPEGAVPKDGPSAGVTMTTAMVSALSHVPVRNDVAMTGEVTIRGKVLPIGGLKEKVLAAKRKGIKKIIIPYENESDLEEIPDYAKDGIEFVLAQKVDDVLENALVRS
ncbi:MAG: endopeptidase La [Firmicutes bacterium]|nr:endopeptidase La [Bacillota bacterium]